MKTRYGSLLIVALTAGATFAATSALSGQVPDSLAPAFEWDPNDPRVGLGAGWMDAESAISNLEHIGSVPRPEGFFDPTTPGAENLKNSDLAFQGDYLFQGNYNGFQIFDISDPRDPQLEAAIKEVLRLLDKSSPTLKQPPAKERRIVPGQGSRF